MIVAGKQDQLETYPLRNRGSGAGSGLAACARAHPGRSPIHHHAAYWELPTRRLPPDGDIIARATAIFRVLVWPGPHPLAGDEAQPVKRERQTDWNRLKALALSLGLAGVEETTSWGQPTLKAHGKLWVWWSPHEDAPVFKVPFEEREVLVEAEPETFFFTPHYRNHALVLVRPEKLDPDWARANLIKVWRAQAPKRVLKAYDAAQERKS